MSWCFTCGFAFASGGSGLNFGIHHIVEVEFVLGDESGWPLALVVEIVAKLSIVERLLGLGVSVLFGEEFGHGASHGLFVDEEFEPFVPVTLVPFFGVKVLHMIVCFISNIKDLIQHLSTQLSSLLLLILLLIIL